MSYLALYRRFRPSGFDKLVGQESIIKTLINQIEGDKVGHAYLFCGARGTGKTSCAKIFARAVNCLHPVNGSPCGKCEACVNLSAPSNIDILEIDAASNNKVEEIREIREKIQYPPVHGRYKVYIIDEVHMLTDSAFNALLKTLEEPPKHALFILATTEPHKMPATILSRCMRFDFKLIPTSVIAELIGSIYKEVGKEFDKEAVFRIAKAGEGSVRDALSVADICLSYSNEKLTYADVLEVLGASDGDNINKLCGCLLDGDGGGALSLIDALVSSGKSVGVLTKDIISRLRDIMVAKSCASGREILGMPQSEYDSLKKCAEGVDERRALRLIDVFSGMESSLRYSNNPRILLESAALKGARPENDFDLNSMLYRLNALEEKLNGLAETGNFGAAGNAQDMSEVRYENSFKTVKSEKASGVEAKLFHEELTNEKAVQEQKFFDKTIEKKTEPLPDVNLSFKEQTIEPAEYGLEPPPEEEEMPFVPEIEMKLSSERPEKRNDTGGKAAADIPKGKVFGFLIKRLRTNNKIMLWAALSEQSASEGEGTLTILTKDENSYRVLSKPDNFSQLEKELSALCGFRLKIQKPGGSVDTFGEDAEALRRAFGEDITTIK